MSFSELISSGKGPGVIGMLMAVMVLLGFGLLFMYSYDETMQGGGPTLAGAIKENEKTLAEQESNVSAAEARLASIPLLKKIAEETKTMESINSSLESQVAGRKAVVAATAAALAESRQTFSDYKDQYREFVRNSDQNRQIEELVTRDGTVYKNVEIRKVTAVGIEIRHADGIKRIVYEELPDEMKDYYQFDEDQKLAAIQREAVERKQHMTAVSLAHEAADAQAVEERIKNQKKAQVQLKSLLASGQARVRAISREIRQLEIAISTASGEAASARRAGRMHISRVGPLRSQLSAKRAEYARVQAELARLGAQR